MVMRVKRPLVPGIIPPCLITCVCIPVETGRAPSHPLKMVFKITVRRWETGHAPSLQLDDNHSRTFYATLQVA